MQRHSDSRSDEESPRASRGVARTVSPPNVVIGGPCQTLPLVEKDNLLPMLNTDVNVRMRNSGMTLIVAFDVNAVASPPRPFGYAQGDVLVITEC